MGLFSKKSAGPKVPPEIANLPWVKNPAPIDDDFGDPGPAAVASALQSGDWRSARNTLLSLSPVSRSHALGSGHLRTDPPVAAAERWVAEAPDDGWGHLMLGSLLTYWAWEARGSGYVSTVGENAWEVFFERLQRAEPVLWQASRLLPGEVDPWNQLIWSGIGLEIPLEELATRYDEGQRRVPFHSGLVNSTLQMLCAKWHGTTEQMFSYARMVVADAPLGSAAMGVLPMAYLEHLLELARDVSIDDACQSLFGREVREEVTAAAERSIFHPDFVPDAFGLAAANQFLVVGYHGEYDPLSQRVIDLLRGRYCNSPFDYFGDADRMSRKAEVLTAKALGRPWK